MRTIAGALLLLLGVGLGAPAAAQPGAPAAAEAPGDPFAGHRRVDGTLIWESLVGANVRPGARLERFSLEFFVKELAKVAATGERGRVEEFFEGVLATDFYKNYGMYVVGSTAAEIGYDIAYQSYLRRYLKPGFVSGVLRANIAMATGLALAQTVTGEFDGKVFAVSMASLGLSSTLVNAGLTRISWVRQLRTTIAAPGATRLLRVGGFVYQTAELALIFFVGRIIEAKLYELYDRRQARQDLAAAGQALIDEVRRRPTLPELEPALLRYDQAWTVYRNFLYKPLFEARAKMILRLEKLAAQGKQEADAARAARARADRYAGLPLEAFLDRRTQRTDAELQGEAEIIVAAYLHDFEESLRGIYQADRRRSPLFADLAFDGPAEFGPAHASQFAEEHRSASTNRLQTYDDQHAALAVVARLLTGEAAATVRAAQQRLDRVRQADLRLFRNELGLRVASPEVGEPPASAGIVARLTTASAR